MNKASAIELFGSVTDLAVAPGITRQAIYQWREELAQDQQDRIVGAAIRIGRMRRASRGEETAWLGAEARGGVNDCSAERAARGSPVQRLTRAADLPGGSFVVLVGTVLLLADLDRLAGELVELVGLVDQIPTMLGKRFDALGGVVEGGIVAAQPLPFPAQSLRLAQVGGDVLAVSSIWVLTHSKRLKAWHRKISPMTGRKYSLLA